MTPFQLTPFQREENRKFAIELVRVLKDGGLWCPPNNGEMNVYRINQEKREFVVLACGDEEALIDHRAMLRDIGWKLVGIQSHRGRRPIGER